MKRKSGVTLIELMIALSIVVILAAIAMTYYRSQIFKGNDARRKSDINRIKIAVEEYEKDHNCYPQYVVCGALPQPISPYLSNVPCDPLKNVQYIYETPSGSCPGWYRIYSHLDYSKDFDIISNIGPNAAFNYVSGSGNSPQSTPGIGSGGSTSTPGSGGGSGSSQYYGCRSGVCVPIGWNSSRPGPECDPSFPESSCYGRCGPESFECKTI